LKKFIATLLIMIFVGSSAFGQQAMRKKPSGPRRQLATIVFAGLGGAIMGLSTLSFYGRPQEQLSNIAIGFAVGVIVGTVYVTFRSATTREYYEGPVTNSDGSPRGVFLDQKKLAPEISTDLNVEIKEPKLLWGPLIQKSADNTATSLGGQIAIQF